MSKTIIKTCLGKDCPERKSICCGASAKAISGDEGTGYYACSKCGKEYIGGKCTGGDHLSDVGKMINGLPDQDVKEFRNILSEFAILYQDYLSEKDAYDGADLWGNKRVKKIVAWLSQKQVAWMDEARREERKLIRVGVKWLGNSKVWNKDQGRVFDEIDDAIRNKTLHFDDFAKENL